MSSDGRITPHGRYTLDQLEGYPSSISLDSLSDIPQNLELSTTNLQEIALDSYTEGILDTVNSEFSEGSEEEPLGKCAQEWNKLSQRCENCFERFRIFIEPLTNHPLCPSYMRSARTLGIVLVGLILWGLGKCLVSSRRWTTLCGLVAAAEVVGILIHSITALPPLLGMLLVGIAARNLGLMPEIHDHYKSFYVLRSSALVVLMIRVGFRLDPQRVRRISGLLLGLATLPGIAECVAIAVMSNFLLGLPAAWALLLGLVLAAACPSVVRPTFYLMGGGKAMDTMLLAAAGINDLVAITLLGIDMAVIFSIADNLPYQLLHRVMGAVGGLIVGGLYGIFARYVPEQNDPQVAELRTVMLASLGLTALVAAERIGLTSGGPIACMMAAIVSNWSWQKQGWSTKYNPVATTFDVFWRIMQPIMFLLIGAEVEIDKLNSPGYFAIGVGLLCIAWVLRMCVSLLVTAGSNLTFKERLYISLAWLPKADVQAALSPLALDLARRREVMSDALVEPATQCLMLVLLAVLITAPLSAGLVSKRGLASVLLGKQSFSQTCDQPETTQAETTEAETNVDSTNREDKMT